jgi:hypothetical protein
MKELCKYLRKFKKTFIHDSSSKEIILRFSLALVLADSIVQFTLKAIGHHVVYLVLRSRKCSDIVIELTYDRTNFRPIYRLDLFIPFFKF